MNDENLVISSDTEIQGDYEKVSNHCFKVYADFFDQDEYKDVYQYISSLESKLSLKGYKCDWIEYGSVFSVYKTTKYSNKFNEWFDILIKEKEIDTTQNFEITVNDQFNIMPLSMIVDLVKNASSQEQNSIKDMLVKIDFLNGNIVDYLKHLAKCYLLTNPIML